MKDLKFRDLLPNEIECRVGSTNKDKTGFSLLLYKTARVDANILDETVGAFNWQRKFYQVKNTMVCSIGIYNEDRNEWVWKDDGGDDDYQAEQIKAELSDASKRASFAWSIGRKLYNSPFIWIKVEGENTQYARYSVKEIAYDETSVTKLVIINDKTKKVVYSYGTDTKVSQTVQKPQEKVVANVPKVDENLMYIIEYQNSLPVGKLEHFTEWLYQVTGKRSVNDLDDKEKVRVVHAIRKANQ